MTVLEGGVTAAKGFQAAGVAAGLRKSGKKDMAMVYSEVPAVTAGTFTTNVVKAAPVKWDQKLVKEQASARAVILNSGIANACTGAEGVLFNEKMAQAAAKVLNTEKEMVLTASTGVIGMQLPADKIEHGAGLLKAALQDTREAGHDAALAIMTTDTIPKECAVSFPIQGKTVTLGGMSKGSGMIHPNMATMLSVITTDAAISKELLQEALSADIKTSFNMISVDRDTSTNDTLLILANGLAGNEQITKKDADYELFCQALNYVTTTLAKMMAGDGEGATKLFEVMVVGAESKEQAAVLSKSVITSNLVKTAIYGSDANWGRILCAMGYSGADFDPDAVDVTIQSSAGTLLIVKNGMAADYSEEFATEILSKEQVTALIDVKMGAETATAWGCDLTYDYVKINGDYRS
ncbi:bifunctional glutamate N-acetyltransferase/amino-acid acetyltransferase ArgJ [Anaerolentibacter hominis]|uniref:bifunctional glutamate N-acetyltransferase/amino-acid acetyltransferase ArgJ n=1 Tax=Anaerolentibacter hominis TaxID=3079009 RepID=UPI0031B81B67